MPTQCRCGLQSLGLESCYWHTQAEVDWSVHPPASNGLSPEQRAFIGLSDPRPRSDWRSADGWVNSLEPDTDIDAERVAMFRVLVALSGGDQLPSV